MGVEKFGFDEVRNVLEQQNSIPDDDMITYLSYLGEELCNHARNITPGHSSGGFDDQTGNLRSSIGYRILKDGQPTLEGGFKNIHAPEGNGENGEGSARSALDNFSSTAPKKGWTIIIVAGMNYAEYVEEKGYNVLHLTKIEMDAKVAELKKELGL